MDTRSLGIMGTIRALLEYHAGVAPYPFVVAGSQTGESEERSHVSRSLSEDILEALDDYEERNKTAETIEHREKVRKLVERNARADGPVSWSVPGTE